MDAIDIDPKKDGPEGPTKVCKGTKAKSKHLIKAIMANGDKILATGRQAQTLKHLIEAGTKGATSLDFSKAGWARRTSAYIHALRKMGISILGPREKTSDGASVSRYILIEPLSDIRAFGFGNEFQLITQYPKP